MCTKGGIKNLLPVYQALQGAVVAVYERVGKQVGTGLAAQKLCRQTEADLGFLNLKAESVV